MPKKATLNKSTKKLTESMGFEKGQKLSRADIDKIRDNPNFKVSVDENRNVTVKNRILG